jgi:hypothetical protein
MEARLYDVSDKSRIGVAIRVDLSHGIGYEASVPLTAIFGTAPVSSRDIRSLVVGIVINALKSEGGIHGSGNSQVAVGGLRAVMDMEEVGAGVVVEEITKGAARQTTVKETGTGLQHPTARHCTNLIRTGTSSGWR